LASAEAAHRRQFLRDKPGRLSKNSRMFRRFLPLVTVLALAPTVRGATIIPDQVPNQVIISVREQKLLLLQNGARLATYPVSTSKFGLGDASGRMTTPLGFLAVARKIGDHAPTGAVFHNRRFTGEILAPNAPGRDPVITRIIWLRGLELQNAHAFSRCIYIHGTPEEKLIGRPASYGCIRMKSSDVASLYEQLPLGALVQIVSDKLPRVPKAPKNSAPVVNLPTAPQEKSVSVPLLATSGRGA
jgi:lipoprotein-anchoring transpeptidase ErfK/SrfK